MDSWDKKIKEKLEGYPHPDKPSEQQVSAFFDKLDAQSGHKKRTSRENITIMKIAAAFAILALMGVSAYQAGKITETTGAGEQATIELPDGSEVILNAHSSVAYNKLVYTIHSRRLKLDGEAFFKVREGKPFTVTSGEAVTSVLGTSFNIDATPKKYEVMCFTGQVEVSSGTVRKLLNPGNGIRINQKKGEVTKISTRQKAPRWKTGEMQFENERLAVVMKEMARIYDIRFQNSEKYAPLRYTGFFPISDLELALKLVFDPLGISYKRQNGTVILSDK